MTPPDLAGIIERDETFTTRYAADDRRALLGLLRETRDVLAVLHADAQAFRGNKPYRESDPTEEPLTAALVGATGTGSISTAHAFGSVSGVAQATDSRAGLASPQAESSGSEGDDDGEPPLVWPAPRGGAR